MTIFHLLKLFSADQDVIDGKKKLVNELYDEIIFNEPSQFFYQVLTNTRPLTSGIYKHDTDCKTLLNHNYIYLILVGYVVKDREAKTVERLIDAKQKVRNEIQEVKDRIKLVQDKIKMLKEKVDGEDLVVEDAI